MRAFTFKGLFLTVVFMLLGCLSIQAADDDLITKQITIKLDKAGTLPNKIGSSEKYKITNLKIVGEINGTDWKMIRVMAGRDYWGDVTEENLSVLDLSEAKIVNGGDEYFVRGGYTSNDQIGFDAFNNCSGLTSLTLPAGITSIGDGAFYGCSGLTSLNLPDGITSIGDYAFCGCSGLTSLNLPAGITIICEGAFYNCSGLTSLNLPAGITKIYNWTFSGCSGLTSLTLPAGITSIGDYAFSRCSGLTSLNLPDGITTIGYAAFSGCSGLTSLTLPAGITEIYGSAFKNCTGLTSLNLPAGITSIGGGAFYGCSGLKEVRFCINDNLDTYLTKGHPYIDVDCGVKYYLNDKEITSIEIPSNVTTLGHYVFQGCRELTSVTLPAGITSIGSSAFEGCSGLTSIYVYAEKVPGIGSDAFKGCDAKKCILYVPKGTYADYRSSEFGYFENIVEFDATGIDKTTTSTDVEEVSRYSVNGQRLVGPTKGLNIVKYSDGSVKKVAVE